MSHKINRLFDVTKKSKKRLILRSKFLKFRLKGSDVACLALSISPLRISVLGFPLFSKFS